MILIGSSMVTAIVYGSMALDAGAPQAIVRQQNKMSYAMVWPWKEDGHWRIGCFIAGTGT